MNLWTTQIGVNVKLWEMVQENKVLGFLTFLSCVERFIHCGWFLCAHLIPLERWIGQEISWEPDIGESRCWRGCSSDELCRNRNWSQGGDWLTRVDTCFNSWQCSLKWAQCHVWVQQGFAEVEISLKGVEDFTRRRYNSRPALKWQLPSLPEGPCLLHFCFGKLNSLQQNLSSTTVKNGHQDPGLLFQI